MSQKKRSFRGLLLFAFLGLSSLLVLSLLLRFWFYYQVTQLDNINDKIATTLPRVLAMIKLEEDFFNRGVLDSNFYLKGETPLLKAHQDSLAKVEESFILIRKELKNASLLSGNEVILKHLDENQLRLAQYKASFGPASNYLQKRGFKQYGLAGQLDLSAQKVRQLSQSLNDFRLLELIILEKEYRAYKELKQAEAFQGLVESIRSSLARTNPELDSAQILLKNYEKEFKTLVSQDRLIGRDYLTSEYSGQKMKTEKYARELVSHVSQFLSEVSQMSNDLRKDQFFIFIILVGIAIVFSVWFSYYYANRFTKPITALSQVMEESIQNQFRKDTLNPQDNNILEIHQLNKSFNIMINHLQEHLQLIEDKNQLLSEKNQDLERINHKISQSEQRLVQLNTVKNKFFSILSHDLRSPLGSIIGFLKILEFDYQSFTPEEINLFCKETQKAVNRILSLLENLLQWSLSETGEIAFNPQKIDLAEIISENIALYQVTASEKLIELEKQGNANFWVYADANMLNFVCRNLISNAIKFSHAQSKIILQVKEHGEEVEIRVIDQGVGMPPETVEKLFQSSAHFSRPGTAKEKGTGFGLLLCKNFVERNQGSIWIESLEGKGTQVIFTVRKFEEGLLIADPED